ncbi:MAG: cyclic nucleotide-binding domain-containing protein [Treponema sp.]|nr:cyclic nucleotide-binding domain-containing protein [Treponema sp.]
MVDPTALQKYSLFGGLLEEQIEGIIPFMLKEEFNPGDYIITEGKPNDKIFFLTRGQVSVTKGDIELSKFSEGEAFGEMEVLDVMPSVASIKALTQVTVLSISNKGLRDIYKFDTRTFSLIIMNLARDLSRRLRRMDERLASSPVLL